MVGERFGASGAKLLTRNCILTKVAFLVRQRDEGNDSHEYNGETGLQYVLARYESGAKGQRRLTERKT